MGENIDIRFGKGMGEEGAKSLNRRPKYCGLRLRVGQKEYLSVYATAALTLGYVYRVTYSQTAGQELKTATPATDAGTCVTAVPYQAERLGVIAWLQVGGEAEASVEGTTDVAAGDFLEVLNGETDFKKDGTLSKNSAAVAVDAQATNSAVVCTVMLINKAHEIAAS